MLLEQGRIVEYDRYAYLPGDVMRRKLTLIVSLGLPPC